MRLTGREVRFSVKVTAAADVLLPIRMRGGGLTYSLTPEEAIDLATRLADAVTQLKEQENHHE